MSGVPSKLDGTAGRAWRRAPGSMLGATVFGIGHLPGGPGTYAAAAVLPAVWAASAWPLVWRLLGLAALIAVATLWSTRASRALEEPDSRRIVIDEVVGVWVALVWFDNVSIWAVAAGFVVFRILDILKPPGAGRFHDPSRGEVGGAGASGGWAIVADDIVAGLWTVPVVWWIHLTLG